MRSYCLNLILTSPLSKNADAEGRLTMADALVYADKELDCEEIVECSTLTGASMVALGGSIAGLFTDSDCLAERLLASSKVTGEKLWRMPLEKEYNKQLESRIADIKNVGGRFGGAITAGLFLQNFVEKKKNFAHVDMAGTFDIDCLDMNQKLDFSRQGSNISSSIGYSAPNKGPVWDFKKATASGYGAKLLSDYICHQHSGQSQNEPEHQKTHSKEFHFSLKKVFNL